MAPPVNANFVFVYTNCVRRSQWPRGLISRSAATRLLRLWVRIPPRKWISVCCVLSGRGLCDEMITCPEEIYLLCFVVMCDLETSRMRRSWPTGEGEGEGRRELLRQTTKTTIDILKYLKQWTKRKNQSTFLNRWKYYWLVCTSSSTSTKRPSVK